MFTGIKNIPPDSVTWTHAGFIALGAVGALVSYRAGLRVGEWIYDKHIEPALSGNPERDLDDFSEQLRNMKERHKK